MRNLKWTLSEFAKFHKFNKFIPVSLFLKEKMIFLSFRLQPVNALDSKMTIYYLPMGVRVENGVPKMTHCFDMRALWVVGDRPTRDARSENNLGVLGLGGFET